MPIAEVRTQIYLQRDQHRALKRAAKKRSISMAQAVREAVASYLIDETSSSSTAADNENGYLSDSAWKLLEAAEEIGGSGSHENAARLEEELYGPIEG